MMNKNIGGHTMTTKTYQLETVTCPSCIAKIEGMLKKTQGIHESEVLFNTSRVNLMKR
jgi:copper chaperone CopZ